MPVSVNREAPSGEKYETPFVQKPEGRLSLGIEAGALDTSLVDVVDGDGVLVPGSVFTVRYDGLEPLSATPHTPSVQSADTGNNELTLSGDWTDLIQAGSTIAVEGSTGNDGWYFVVRAQFGGTNTTVTVPNLPDGTGDGEVKVGQAHDVVGLVPYSLNLFDGSFDLSTHGSMDLVVATRGEVNRTFLEDQLGRGVVFEEYAAITDAPQLTIFE